MLVIGLTGTIGSGKDTVREILEKKLQTVSIRLSDLLDTSVLKKRGITLTRSLQQEMGNELRQKYGSHVLAKIAFDFMKKTDQVKVIDGIRNPGEIEFLKNQFGDSFKLIAVDAPFDVRFERTVKRARPTDPKVKEDFTVVDGRDQGNDQPPYGQQVKKCMEMADFNIENTGDMKELEKKVIEVISKL